MDSYEPTEITGGETIEWRKSLTDYKPGEGWELTYYFRSSVGVNFNATGTADGASWVVSAVVPVVADETGTVYWEAWVKKGIEERRVGKGTVTLTTSLKTAPLNSPFDGHTQAEKDLDAVRAALAPATAAGVQEYEITGVNSSRRLRYFSREELIALEATLAQRVNGERRAAAQRRGAPYFKTIHLR